MRCPKCHAISGDDWSQCEGKCPMPMSPHYKEKNVKPTRLMPIQAWFQVKKGVSQPDAEQMYVETTLDGKHHLRRWDPDQEEPVEIPQPIGTDLVHIPDQLVPEMWNDFILDSDEYGVWFIGLEDDVRGAKALMESVEVLCSS